MAPAESNLVRHARAELRRAGLFDADADYDGALAESVMALIEVFSSQGHSGMSGGMTIDLFGRLAGFEALSALTTDPSEWVEVGHGIWQNRRDGAAFSKDGGKTYRRNGDPDGTYREAVTPVTNARA